MTSPAAQKIVLFHDVPPAVRAALRAHLCKRGDVVMTENESPTPPDVIICGENAVIQRAAVPILRLAPPDRLGVLLSAVGRALDEPALAVSPFMIAGLLFSPAAKTLTQDNTARPLTEREAALLLYLSRQAPQAVARDALLRAVWQYQDGVDTHTLETHIYRLRQKLEPEGAPPILKTTADGYALTEVSPAADDSD